MNSTLVMVLLWAGHAPAQTVLFDEAPTDMQLFPRDLVSNMATVTVSGQVVAPGYDRILLKTRLSGNLIHIQTQTLTYAVSTNALTVTNNLRVWLRADAGVERNGVAVTNWIDQSGNSHDASQSTAGAQPVFSSNVFDGGPGLVFDGNDFLNSVSGMTTGSYTKVVVHQLHRYNIANNLLSSAPGGPGIDHALFYQNSPQLRLWHSGSFAVSQSATALSNTTFAMAHYDAAADAGWLFQDGQLTSAGLTAIGDNRNTGYQVGGHVNGNFLDGAIAELMIYDTLLSQTERGELETYLNRKYRAGPTNATFNLSRTILAQPAGYDFEVCLVQGTVTTVVRTINNVVAGDVYLINGQSNAEARMFGGSANGNQHPFVRSFGVRDALPSALLDQAWRTAEGDMQAGPAAVGQWGLRLGRRLFDAHQIPVALLNGARGGQPIDYFQRTDASHIALNNNYGRLLFRAQQAGVADRIRGVFWYQGESDGANGPAHESGFIALYNDWLENYPGLERVYLHQIRVGCALITKNDVDLRDRQRRLPDAFPGMTVLSTTGLNGHDGCHFSYANGYESIGDHLFDLLNRDFYGSPDRPNIEAPNIASVVFGDPVRTSLIVRTRNPTDHLVFDPGAELDFLVAGSGVTVVGGAAEGNRIRLGLSADGVGSTGLTYTGHIGAGPWVTNVAGVGLLTFSRVPIQTLTTPPFSPTNLVGLALNAIAIRLTWDDVTNATRFLIRRDGVIIDDVFGSAYDDLSVSPSSNYVYDVAAVNPAGTSAFSSVVMVSTPAIPATPLAPTGLVALAVSADRIDLSWVGQTNADVYIVFRDGSEILRTAATNLSDTGLAPTTRYDYVVAAVNLGGTSAVSAVATATTFPLNVFASVPEATNFTLVYCLPLPANADYRGANPVGYSVDNTASIAGHYDRVAYYLELDDGTGLQWVYVSIDPLTPFVHELGLPH
ncbi:MAG: sialate O-acetylesterase, partial [Verrucomicrobiota bacterium]